MLRAFLFNPPDPLFKGAIRACGLSIAAVLSLPANSGPASDDALLALRSEFFALLCRCWPEYRRCARPLSPPCICCRNGGKIDSFAYVIGFMCANTTFCTRHAVFERSRVQIRPFCPCRPSLILTRTVARARSAQGVSQFAAGYAAVRRTASPDSI